MSQPPTPTEITVKGKAARIRGATWTHDQVKKLFDVWTRPDIYQGLQNEKKKLDIFKNIASTLTDQGINRTWRECRAKIKNLKADYRKAVDKKTNFRYLEEMRKIMNLDGSASETRRSGGSGTMKTLDAYFTPSGASTPHSSQSQYHYDDDDEGQEKSGRQSSGAEEDSYRSLSPITAEQDTLETDNIQHETPSTSRSVIQSVSQHHVQYQPQELSSSFHSSSLGHQSRDDDSSSSYKRYTPPPSTSSKMSQYSSSIDMQQLQQSSPYTSPYYKKEHYHQSHHEDNERRYFTHYSSSQQSPYRYERITADDDNVVVEHDSTSRSSMIITHVVSNVIEPVTQVIMPSSSRRRESHHVSEDLSIARVREPIMVQDDSSEKQVTSMSPIPPPLRLEFVLEDENVILQPPRSPISDDEDVTDSAAIGSSFTSIHIEPCPLSTTPPPPPPPITTTVDKDHTSKTPPSQILRQTLNQQKRLSTATPKTRSLPTKAPPRKPFHHHPKRKTLTTPSSTTPASKKTVPVVQSRKRKLLETLNRKTVETISDLLTETSQGLLKELQDAEQRFIQWEEEKRVDERNREEAMFTKLIAAMKSSASSSVFSSTSPKTANVSLPILHQQTTETEQENESALVANFSNISKRINDMVCGEVKQTEESLRQWEMKMQRHESRHTEKLFGMIINAIKTTATTTFESGSGD